MTVGGLEIERRPAEGDATNSEIADRLAIVVEWINRFIARPNSDLGRVGDVCPYMERAMGRAYAEFRSFDGREGDERLLELVREVRVTLLARAVAFDGDPHYLTTVIVPRGLPDPELADQIARVHEVLKPEFVEHGLMLGEFWPDHVGQGLHNEDFRPLASPLPMLAVRHMVLTDLWFLTLPSVMAVQQIEFLGHYRRVFDGQLSERWKAKLHAAEETALAAVAAGRSHV